MLRARRDAKRRGHNFAATSLTDGSGPESKQREEILRVRARARATPHRKNRDLRCSGCVTPCRIPMSMSTYAALPRLSAPFTVHHLLRPLLLLLLLFLLLLSFLLLLPLLLLLEVCPPLSLATRCRRTRDLRGAEPSKTITKCQGCHCATRMGCARAYCALAHSLAISSLPPLFRFP